MSLMDRFKGKLQAAGEETKRLSRIGQLKLDKMSAETALNDAYQALGKAVADRFIDRQDGKVTLDDSAVNENTDRVRRARIALAEVIGEMDDLAR